jgi:hypothetical protein
MKPKKKRAPATVRRSSASERARNQEDRFLPMPEPMKKKTGRPSMYEDNPTFFDREGEKLATLGVTHKDMAWYWGIDADTVTRWKDSHPTFADAIKKGESSKRISLLTSMFRSAMAKKPVPSIQIFLAKNWLGMKDISDLGINPGDVPFKVTIVPVKKKSSDDPTKDKS